MSDNGFSIHQVCKITKLSPRQLRYWRKTGLITPEYLTPGGHARYSLYDLVALQTAKQLIDAGISVQRIRKCVASLTRFLSATNKPLHELALVATGDVVLVLHGRSAFEALTGQEWILDVADIAHEARQIQQPEVTPHQWDLFSDDPPVGPVNREHYAGKAQVTPMS